MSEPYRMYLAGSWVESGEDVTSINPYSGEVVGTTYNASDEQVEAAMQAAVAAFETTRRLPSYRRYEILDRLADLIKENADQLARTIALEAGKPIRAARGEVSRAILTTRTAAEEAKRIYGEVQPLDLAEGAEGRTGIIKRFPIGPVLGITPFNYPLNLVLHKLTPAFAAGCSIVIKPAPATPLVALRLAKLCEDAGFPPGSLSVIPTTNDRAEKMVRDERFKVLSFTGSQNVGWYLKSIAGRKKVILELGGNAGVILDQDADVDRAVERIVDAGFSFAGQSCISVQRVYIHESIFMRVRGKLVHAAQDLKLGDPMAPDTDLGPMIRPQIAKRTYSWITDAIAEGAMVVTGGKLAGDNMLEPTVIAHVNSKSAVCREEVFAPLIGLYVFDDFEEAVARVNDSDYGLQAGVFTNNLRHAWYAFENIEVGALMINDVPTWRIDPMPYGGVKQSGFGREGLRYAIDSMTEMRLMMLNP